MITKNEKTEIITYAELARRVGDMVLMNKITAVVDDLFNDVFNGDLYDENDEPVDIYQYYAISMNSAGYLERNTNELVLYSEELDTHFLAITNFGTPWSDVDVKVKL